MENSQQIYTRLQHLRVKLRDKHTPVSELVSLQERCKILYNEYLYMMDTGNMLINYYNNRRDKTSDFGISICN